MLVYNPHYKNVLLNSCYTIVHLRTETHVAATVAVHWPLIIVIVNTKSRSHGKFLSKITSHNWGRGMFTK